MLLYSEGCLEIHFGIVVAALEQLRYIAKLPVIMQIPLKLANGSKAELLPRSGVSEAAISAIHGMITIM